MSYDRAMLTSIKQDYETRWEVFNPLNDRFHFTLDPCATEGAQKCDKYFTPEQDGLDQDWSGEIFFCNPPYGREQIKWVEYAVKNKFTGVFLLPSRTDTCLFHDTILPNCQVEFMKGRKIFGSDTYLEWVWKQKILNGKPNKLYGKIGKMYVAPFASMLAILNLKEKKWEGDGGKGK